MVTTYVSIKRTYENILHIYIPFSLYDFSLPTSSRDLITSAHDRRANRTQFQQIFVMTHNNTIKE